MSNVHVASKEQEQCYRCGAKLAFWEIQCGACGSEVPKGPRDATIDAYNADVRRMLGEANISPKSIKFGFESPFTGMPIVDHATIVPNQAADQRQVDGKHYKDLKVQPWTVMEAILTRPEFIGYLKGCIIKYSIRQDRKETSPEDGEKCRHYIEKLREMEQIHRITARA